MPNGELLTKARSVAETVTNSSGDVAGILAIARDWILQNFGTNGLYAAYLVGFVLAVFVLSKAVKITFAMLKYLVVPGFGLALVGSFVLPYSFFFLLPITITGCSLLLLFKG
jgi:hypothetical protein